MPVVRSLNKARFRFAPSPNGLLHLGHAYSALLNQKMARDHDGDLLLRIEDVDRTRARPQFEEAIYEDLEWLGVTWAEPVMRQSTRDHDYKQALKQLEGLGVIYHSQISRKQITSLAHEDQNWPRDPEGAPLPPADEVDQDVTKQGAAIRLNMDAALDYLNLNSDTCGWKETGYDAHQPQPKAWGNVVLKTKDELFAYHLAVVVDDAAQNISHIVRGRDLFGATAIHRVLQELLVYAAPRYHHHDLILDGDGQKLAKSALSKSLADLRNEGFTAQNIRHQLGF